ncbi:uncharacterized protein LOC113793060 isoform X1 [Dermatophagoides pteronyssinus]|uniref:uncharacterized protein LOC113793060 isoform X1 n=2 Tax=Dermatophagoides pteronyssinus TaxID=6956 RepID=UPI003F675B37
MYMDWFLLKSIIMKSILVFTFMALVLYTNLIHCKTIAKPEQSSQTNLTTTTATSHNVDEKKSDLHRVRLMSTSDDNNDEKQKSWLPIFDESLNTSADDIKQANATSCSEQCKEHFGTTSDDLEKFQSCINGCRYYTINLILTQNNISAGYTSSLSSVKSECFNSCLKVYPNDTKSISICNFGCRLADNAQTEEPKTRPIITISSVDAHEDSSHNNMAADAIEPENSTSDEERTFSMFIPIPIRTITSASELNGNSQQESLDRILKTQDSSSSSLSRIMMSMVRSMAERARQMIDFARTQQRNMEDSRFSMGLDSSANTGETGGEAVSVERSMSVMMTKDKDGHNKFVVMRKPPKITIHRSWNPLGWDFDQFKTEKATDLNRRFKQLEHEGQEESDGNRFRVVVPWKWSGGWGNNLGQQEQIGNDDRFGNRIIHRLTSFGLPPNQQNNEDLSHDTDDDVMVINTVDPNKSDSLQWSTCLISMMPLLYLLMVILLLYIIIWLFYSVPNYFICINRRSRSHPPSNGRNPSETILPLPLDNDNYRETRRRLFQKLFHLSRAQRYCKLSAFTGLGEKPSPLSPARSPTSVTGADLSPTASTLSFPPPYTEATAGNETFSVPENVNKEKN